MKRFLVLSFICYVICSQTALAFAQTATQSGATNITVTISGNTLNLSGFIAPYASVSLSINGTVLSSAVADKNGNFSFAQIGVPKATSLVCLDAVDFKKLGQSKACIPVTPTNGAITKTQVFLPPTLGVERTDIVVGSSALAYGYGMPGAHITVHLNGLPGCSVSADTNGYYQCGIVIQKAGDYELFADATLQNAASEQQLDKVLVKGIAQVKIVATITPVPIPASQFPGLFAIPWWVWLLLVGVAIISIIILLRKYHPNFGPLPLPEIHLHHTFDSLFRKRKLHHSFLKGVGY